MTMADKIYAPTAEFTAKSHANKITYDTMYATSLSDPNAFWAEQGKRLDWITPFTKVKNTSFEHSDVSIKWY